MGFLIFDEVYDRDHEFKAFQDYLRIWKRDYRGIGQTDNYGKICGQFLQCISLPLSE